MIAFIRGVLVDKFPTFVTVDADGIGYELQIPLSTYERLPQPGEQVQLLTHFYLREDVAALYGFATASERELFRELLTVSGIGPRLALTILSGSSVDQIYQSIAAGDEAALTRIKGLGKKTAQRLILDLQQRAAGKAAVGSASIAAKGETFEQTVAAMMTLGYTRREAEAAVAKAAAKVGANAGLEDLIRVALSGE